ncbi:MAG: universal stress protein [Gammaproteobacteria bacterium]|nr:universal stress protein [Gammaproteobacteria bacterium]
MESQANLIALIDGSVYSASICDHASWIAKRMQASVTLVHALGRRQVSSAPENLSGSIGLGARTALLEELADLDAQKARLAQKRGRAILDDAKTRITGSGVDTVNTRLRIGELVDTVQELEENANLIIIGKRGEAADFGNLHLGSNLERVARSSQIPVLVASREFKAIERVLIAFDGGKSVLKAIDYLASSQAYQDLTFKLLSAGSESTKMRRQLDDAASLIRNAGHKVETAIEPGQAEKVIADAVNKDKSDLLVMGAYGHSKIRNLIIGSTTTEMIRSCKIPVLLFR